MPYLDHFGFREFPFTLTPNRALFFPETHGPVLEAADFALRRGEPIVKVTGEVGTGKTLLCRLLLARLAEHGFTVGFLAMPQASYQATMRAVCRSFRLEVPDDADRYAALEAHLLKEYAANRRVVLVVDEAQALGPKGLETIRLLSNLETDDAKLLQVMLFGQPELDNLVQEYRLRQIAQRITFEFFTERFDLRTGLRYLRHRVSRCSHDAANEVFTPAAAKGIVKAADGIPRVINLLADRALLAAYAADRRRVDRTRMRRAVSDAGFATDGRGTLRRLWPWRAA